MIIAIEGQDGSTGRLNVNDMVTLVAKPAQKGKVFVG